METGREREADRQTNREEEEEAEGFLKLEKLILCYRKKNNLTQYHFFSKSTTILIVYWRKNTYWCVINIS